MSNSYPTPPSSVSPTKSSFQESNVSPSSRRFSSQRNFDGSSKLTTSRRRCCSLGERFPGDMSHRPLEQLRKETKAAHRAPHLKKKHLPGTDTIDSLDSSAFGLLYHHGGPYDATLLAPNRNQKYAPIEALKSSNDEALRATPKDYIRDALQKHMPLQGTATIPAGMRGYDGQIMLYEEGADLMREADAPGGAYRRWADMKYHPDDLKGKGEPSYSFDKMQKKDKDQRRKTVGLYNENGYELLPMNYMSSCKRSASGSNLQKNETSSRYGSSKDGERQIFRRKSVSSGLNIGDELRRRIGSLTRAKKINKRESITNFFK
ncbi:hypothetical protein K3495_g12717 [Podosphaera aphanis]|nr:hypothetical protein K3495_g12717 [Podosphaera aphanis]